MRGCIGAFKATSSAVCAWVGQIASRFPEPAIVTCFLHQRLRSRSGRGPVHRVGGRDLVRRRRWRQRWRRVCHSNISKDDRDCTRTKTWSTLVFRLRPSNTTLAVRGCRLMAIQQHRTARRDPGKLYRSRAKRPEWRLRDFSLVSPNGQTSHATGRYHRNAEPAKPHTAPARPG